MFFAEYEEMFQAFPFDGSHESFGVRIKIRRPVRYALDLGIKLFEQLVKFLGEFRVAVSYE